MANDPTITPAFTPEEWEQGVDSYRLCAEWDDFEPQIIALANDTMDASDSRKLTREDAVALRGLAEILLKAGSALIEQGHVTDWTSAEAQAYTAQRIADVIDSYVRPDA